MSKRHVKNVEKTCQKSPGWPTLFRPKKASRFVTFHVSRQKTMPSVDVILHLSADQCRAHYAGSADSIRTRTTDGRSVLLPSRAISRIIRRDGVQGIFRVHFDQSGRFVSIEAVG